MYEIKYMDERKSVRMYYDSILIVVYLYHEGNLKNKACKLLSTLVSK